jgi:FkbM family methyltransferase
VNLPGSPQGPFAVRSEDFYVGRAVAAPYRIVGGLHGTFLVNENDHYIGRAMQLYGEYSEYEWQVLSAFAGSGRDAVEVGANIGTHTVPLARLLGTRGRRLLAVDAQRAVFQMLCANIALNGLLNVQAENVACSDVAGWVTFDEPDYASLGNFGAVEMKASGGAHRVRAVPLDELVPAGMDVGLVKLDVEGFEQKVLEGARSTVKRCRPVIYLENDRPQSSRALIELLWSMNYEMWWHRPWLYRPDNFRGNAENIYGEVVSINMLAAPKEMRLNVDGAAERVTDSSSHPLLVTKA